MNSQLVDISFRNQSIQAVMQDGEVFVAMRPIVENIGMAWGTQHQKLERQKDKFNCIHMNTVASDGKWRSVLCIPLRKLNGWLFSVNPEKVRPEIRDYLIAYQEECFTALHDYFTKQEALPSPSLNLPEIGMQWWYENNFPMRRDNLSRHHGHQPWNDLTLSPAMMYGADTKSPALFLIETLEMMGFDLTGPRIEVETMRIMLRKGKGNVRVCGAGNVKHLLAL